MKSIIAHFYSVGLIPQFTFGVSFGISLGGSKGTSESTATTKLDQTKTAEEEKTGLESLAGLETTEQVSTGTTTGESTKTAEGIETSTLALLDEETQNQLRALINEITVGDTGNQELLDLLESRALSADEAFSGIVDPQIAEARRLQEQELGGTVQALSRATGGGAKSSSLVAGFNLEGQRAIDTSIASLAASLGLDARGAATKEISGAFEAGLVEQQQGASAVAQLAEVLKGAEQVGTKETETSEQLASVENVMQALTSATSTDEVKSIIENLFSTEMLAGTETVTSKGKTKEGSAGFSLGF